MNLNLKTALDSVNLLLTLEKIQLIQKITAQIESELKMKMSKPRKSLRCLWKVLDIKDEEILQAKRDKICRRCVQFFYKQQREKIK